MKKAAILLVIYMLMGNITMAQNMVPNGDFEMYTSCPTGLNQVINCTGWKPYPIYYSPDYFNSCATGIVDIPNNYGGSQVAASGNAYVGVVAYHDTSGSRAYITRPIIPLTIGLKYQVSMSVSLAGAVSNNATNNLGAWFYDTEPAFNVYQPLLTAQVDYRTYGVISDTTNWIRLSGTFTADSAYDNIMVGGFYHYNMITVDTLRYGTRTAYYYIDSIVVLRAPISIIAGNSFCLGDTLIVPYEANYPAAATSVFSLQLSDLSGSFVNPTILDTIMGARTDTFRYVTPSTLTSGDGYKLRVVSINPGDSSNVIHDITIGTVPVNKPVIATNEFACIEDTLRLSASTTTPGVSYSWIGPDNFSSAIQNPVINHLSLSARGQYIVSAKLYGCIGKDTINLSIIRTDSLLATGSPDICQSDSIKLDAYIPGSTVSITWNGPNSFSSSVKNTNVPNAPLAAEGDYILSANYDVCVVSDTVHVQVRPLPANCITTTNAPICINDTLRLQSVTSSTGAIKQWLGPNSFSSAADTIIIPAAAANNAGAYYINYELNGCIVKDTINIIVNPLPVPATAIINSPACQTDTLKITAAPQATGSSYRWSGPGSFIAGTRDIFIPNITSAINGDYILTVTLPTGCTAKDTVTVLVRPKPALFTTSSNSPICDNTNLNLSTTTTSSGVSYSWSGPNSFTSTAASPVISPATLAANGNYYVTATLNGCSIKDTVSVQVTPIPGRPTTTANSPVCIGQGIHLTANSINGTTYFWEGPAGFSAITQNPILNNATLSMAGNYRVRAVTNACTSVEDTINVAVIAAPSVGIYPSPKDSICQGSPISFVGTPTNGGISPQYQWYRNGVAVPGATTRTPSITPVNDKDVFYCIMTTTGVCADPFTDTSNAIPITVLPWLAPAVSIVANPNTPVVGGQMINFTATPVDAGKAPTYQWKRNGSDVIGAVSNVWGANNLDNNDTICVIVKSSYQCPLPATAKSNCIVVQINTTGITHTQLLDNISIYPNPVTNELTIEGLQPKTTIHLFDVVGNLVHASTASSIKETINTSALPTGTYLLQMVQPDGRKLTAKITKQ